MEADFDAEGENSGDHYAPIFEPRDDDDYDEENDRQREEDSAASEGLDGGDDDAEATRPSRKKEKKTKAASDTDQAPKVAKKELREDQSKGCDFLFEWQEVDNPHLNQILDRTIAPKFRVRPDRRQYADYLLRETGLSDKSEPASFFFEIWPVKMLKCIRDETNRYAVRIKVPFWKDATLEEIVHVIGIFLNDHPELSHPQALGQRCVVWAVFRQKDDDPGSLSSVTPCLALLR